jgi:hypothetical protein
VYITLERQPVDFLQSIDPGNALLAALGCICLCGLGFILITSLHLVGSIIGIFTSVFEVFFDILGGGPVAWCGCLLLIGVCIGGVGIAILIAQGIATCGTDQAINFCTLLGQ